MSELSEELQKVLYDYTNGEYSAVCNYSQYIVDKGNMIYSSPEWFEKNILPNITEQQKKNIEKLVEIIENQPVSDKPLYRIEGGVLDVEEGDEVSFGIRSTSQDSNFANMVINSDMEGFNEIESKDYTGNYTEYFFDKSKSLDLSEISAYKGQHESLIVGRYKVTNVETIEAVKPHWEYEEILLNDELKAKGIIVEYTTSKKGNEIVKWTEDGVVKTETVERFNKKKVTNRKYVEGVFGRKVVHLEIIE